MKPQIREVHSCYKPEIYNSLVILFAALGCTRKTLNEEYGEYYLKNWKSACVEFLDCAIKEVDYLIEQTKPIELVQ